MRSNIKRYIPFYPAVMLLIFAFNNEGVKTNRAIYFFVFLVRYILLEPIRLIEVFVFDHRIKKHQLIEDPIFIIGHWRSGTSHLQNLLQMNPNYTTTTIFKFVFADTYYLTENWLKNPLNWVARIFAIRFSFQRVPLNFDLPGELDSGLCALCSPFAYTWGHLFPRKFAQLTNPLLLLDDPNMAKKWIEDYDYLIRKLSYKEKNKRVIVKSPGDTSRVPFLLRKYPNAKFIYIHRDPTDVFHSSQYLWSIIQKEHSFQTICEEDIDRHIIETYKLLLSRYLSNRKEIPSNQLVEIAFNDLQKKPVATLELINSKLRLGLFPMEKIIPYLEQNKKYIVNQYQTLNELELKLKTEWKFSYEQMPIATFNLVT